eukprot:scaffold405_cov137-Skeletonema_menzelii.AAC.6
MDVEMTMDYGTICLLMIMIGSPTPYALQGTSTGSVTMDCTQDEKVRVQRRRSQFGKRKIIHR